MRFHPLGYAVLEQYPGQHPAEAMLDRIADTLRDTSWDAKSHVMRIQDDVEGYFAHKATLPATPDYNPEVAGPALNEIRKIAHALVVGLVVRDKLRNGWPMSLAETTRLVEELDQQMQYLWPDIHETNGGGDVRV